MVASRLFSASALMTLALAASNSNNGGGDVNGLTLLSNAIQKGSEVDGTQSLGAETGQTASQTSNDNFINFCSGQTLTNGLQILGGSCNGIPMGKIPAKNTMISTVILNPQNGQTIESGTTFNITLQVNNLQAGDFTDADATYYSAPQDLNGQGQIVGHTHVTVQDVGKSLNPTTPPDPTQFAFFKGINDPGNGHGGLSAEVTGGLPPGNYRVCTLTSSANHQPVLMPVAQRGSQDDCRYFTVDGHNDTTNIAANDGSKGEAAAAAAASAVQLGPGAVTAGSGSAAASATSSAAASDNGKGKGAGGAKEVNGKGSSTTTTTAAASKHTAASKGGKGAEEGKSSTAASKGGKGAKSGEKRDCGPERRARRRRYVS